MPTKYCFMNKDRVCDLTCKAAFEQDDPVDPVDCYFIWLATHLGEGFYDLRKMMELGMGGLGPLDVPGAAPKAPGTDPEGGVSNN